MQEVCLDRGEGLPVHVHVSVQLKKREFFGVVLRIKVTEGRRTRVALHSLHFMVRQDFMRKVTAVRFFVEMTSRFEDVEVRRVQEVVLIGILVGILIKVAVLMVMVCVK